MKSAGRTKTINQEYYSWQTCPSTMEKLRLSQMKNPEKFLTIRLAQGNAKESRSR